jgi:hypothetical protein
LRISACTYVSTGSCSLLLKTNIKQMQQKQRDHVRETNTSSSLM